MSALDIEFFEESAALEEFVKVVAIVPRLVLELIYGYAHLDSLGVLDSAQYLLVDGAFFNQLHQGVQKELVGIGAFLLVGLELLLELAGN